MNFLRRFKNSFHKFQWSLRYYLYNSFLTRVPSYAIRTNYLRKILKIRIGKDTSIHMGCFFSGNRIVIGDNCVIGRSCQLDGRAGLIEICNNVSVSSETCILSMSHLVDSETFETVIKPVHIEDYVWIGTRCMILPGVRAGKGSVLAAGAIVTKNVAPYTIVAGSPAKKIGERNNQLHYNLKYFPLFNSDIY